MAILRSHAANDKVELEARWAKRWIASLTGTVLLLIAAAAVGGAVLSWVAIVACIVLTAITLITQSVIVASDRPVQARKRTALATVRWLATALAALALALVVQATIATGVGAMLASVAIIALLGACTAFFVRW